MAKFLPPELPSLLCFLALTSTRDTARNSRRALDRAGSFTLFGMTNQAARLNAPDN
jgi:hypothetical protein